MKLSIIPAALLASAAVSAHAQQGGSWDWRVVSQTPLEPRWQTCAASIGPRMFLFGDGNGDPLSHSFAGQFNAVTSTWQPLPSLPEGRGQAAAVSVGRFIVVLGGNNCYSNCWLDTVWILDTASHAPEWVQGPSLPSARGHLAAVTIGSRIYVFGGDNSYVQPSAFDDCYVLDAAAPSPQWVALPSMPRRRSHHGAAVVDGKICIVGGWRDVHPPGGPVQQFIVPEVDVFDPETGTWWPEAMTLPIPVMDCTVLSAAGGLYVLGGNTGISSNATAAVQRFDAEFGAWEAVTPLPAPRANASGAALGRRLYLFGGSDDTGKRSEVFVGVPVGGQADAWDSGW